tara:strand:+ start:65 stop:508 length:444 start_codon:yes stop_codon:yes gene_type:complete
MPSYPAKPYVVPHDDWFNNNSKDFENKSKTKGTNRISTIHEFFYKKSNIKVGGSENLIQTNLEKKSTTKLIFPSHYNSDESLYFTTNKKFNYSRIPSKIKSIKIRSFERNSTYKNLPNKKFFSFGSILLDLKTIFYKVITRKKKKLN